MPDAPANTDLRVPPHNLDAERAVLGTLLLDPDTAANIFGIVAASDFHDPRHRLLYQTVQAMSDEEIALDPMTLIERLGRDGNLEKIGGPSYVAGLEAAVISPANVVHHARIVHQKSLLRQLIRMSGDFAEKAYKETDPPEELLTQYVKAVTDILQAREAKEFSEFESLALEVYEDVLQRSENRQSVTGLPTGLSLLDRLTGGFQRSDLIILAARPSVGKTSLALNFAAAVADSFTHDDAGREQRRGVAIFSLEMSESQVAQRMICTRARVPMSLLRKNMLNQNQLADFKEAAEEMQAMPIFVNDTPGLDPTEMRLQAQQLKMRHPELALVVVDYLQLMSVKGGSRDGRQQEVSQISRALKALARDLDVPVIALSQLSRQIENRPRAEREPRLADLRESGAIEQDADMVMFIHRMAPPGNENEDGGNRGPEMSILPVDLLIAKQRNGPLGRVPLLFRADYTHFVPRTDQEPPR